MPTQAQHTTPTPPHPPFKKSSINAIPSPITLTLTLTSTLPQPLPLQPPHPSNPPRNPLKQPLLLRNRARALLLNLPQLPLQHRHARPLRPLARPDARQPLDQHLDLLLLDDQVARQLVQVGREGGRGVVARRPGGEKPGLGLRLGLGLSLGLRLGGVEGGGCLGWVRAALGLGLGLGLGLSFWGCGVGGGVRAAGEGGRGGGLERLAWDWGRRGARGGVGEGCVHLGCQLEMLVGNSLT